MRKPIPARGAGAGGMAAAARIVRERFGIRLALVVCVAALVLLASPAWAATFIVDSTADAPDNAPGNGECLTMAEVCTLRAAIQEALCSPDS